MSEVPLYRRTHPDAAELLRGGHLLTLSSSSSLLLSSLELSDTQVHEPGPLSSPHAQAQPLCGWVPHSC